MVTTGVLRLIVRGRKVLHFKFNISTSIGRQTLINYLLFRCYTETLETSKDRPIVVCYIRALYLVGKHREHY